MNISNGNISNKVKIRKDLLNYNLSMSYIAKENRVSKYIMEKELLNIDSGIPKYIKNLPAVISFNEFKADIKSGKYAFILNDPIQKMY